MTRTAYRFLVVFGLAAFVAGCGSGSSNPVPKDRILTNIEESKLTNRGWTTCWSETYATSGTTIASVLASCTGQSLMMACRPVGNTAFTLAAWGDKVDVTTDTGANSDVTHDVGKVSWYYHGELSWGFAPAGDGVNKNECDYNDGVNPNQDKRLCWHVVSSAVSDGYRCGDNDLNGDTGWERVLLHK